MSEFDFVIADLSSLAARRILNSRWQDYGMAIDLA
jgi:hypothetical protein